MKLSGQAPNWVVYLILITLSILFIDGQLHKKDLNSREWGLMKNERYDFSFEYPLRWDAEVFSENGLRGYKEVKAIITDKALQPFSIFIYLKPSDSPQLESAMKWGEERALGAAKGTGSTYEELKLTVNDDMKSATRTYLYNSRKVKVFIEQFLLLKCQDVYIVRKYDLIMIKFCVPKAHYDDYLPYFERIVESFTPKE